MPDWLHLYHRLPYPLRVAAATGRGYYLRRWRYDGHTDALAAAAVEREQWSAEKWRAWQAERLAFVLHRAATDVPYYRRQWQDRRRQGDRAAWDLLANWPLLDKESLRRNPAAFVADDADRRRMFPEHTSGTTGTPLHIWWSRDTVREWYALFEARVRGWHGLSRRDRWAILGGQLVVNVRQERPPFWVWNGTLHQLYLSSYHLAPRHIEAYLEALRRHRVVYLLGYPSAIYRLAQAAAEQGLDASPLQLAISNAEPLYEYQRELISRVFACPVRDTYGMAEIVAGASECEAGRLHVWPEVGFLEILEEGSNDTAPAGPLVGTGLLNLNMPLVRYETGDRAAAAPPLPACPCGRSLPILRQIEGRNDDVVITSDGRHIGRLDPIFKSDLPLREAQIIQETVHRLRLRYVPAPGFDESDRQAIERRLRDRVGSMEIVMEPVDAIPRGRAGKFRAVVSQVSGGTSTPGEVVNDQP